MRACGKFIGVTLKERSPNLAGTLVDVGLSKVLSHILDLLLQELLRDSFFFAFSSRLSQ